MVGAVEGYMLAKVWIMVVVLLSVLQWPNSCISCYACGLTEYYFQSVFNSLLTFVSYT